jgi:hypothetical protein
MKHLQRRVKIHHQFRLFVGVVKKTLVALDQAAAHDEAHGLIDRDVRFENLTLGSEEEMTRGDVGRVREKHMK